MTQGASRSSWKAKPSNGPFVGLDYADTFDEEEFAVIRQGRVPRAMEDRWFIFYENSTLYLHRSWTGNLIYRVEFAATPTGAGVSKAEVIDDPEVYRRADIGHEAALLAWLIRALLLRQEFPYPTP